MRFQDEPLVNLFTPKGWKSICDFFGNDNYGKAIIVLDRWLERRFKESLSKEEVHFLVTDFETSLNDAKELLDSAKLFLKAITASLKTGALNKDEVIEFLDRNKDATTPEAYSRCIDFLRKLAIEYEKLAGDGLVVERNYLERHGLFAHLHRIEEGILENYFLDTLKTHVAKLARAVGERAVERIGWAFDIYYSILGKFKRQPKAHFEYYLNATLLGERKYALSDREKMALRDDLVCPFCNYDLKETLKGKRTASVICPNCKIAIAPWAFENYLIPKSELPDSFFRNAEDPKGPTYRVKTFTPTIGEEDFSDLLDRLLLVDPSLTNKEREVVEAIRDLDGRGISMSETLREIAKGQGKSNETIRMHYKSAVRKLKNLSKKH
jgi:DNA-binding CsgD family transcriptional regulator